jgi:hypothetical protein
MLDHILVSPLSRIHAELSFLLYRKYIELTIPTGLAIRGICSLIRVCATALRGVIPDHARSQPQYRVLCDIENSLIPTDGRRSCRFVENWLLLKYSATEGFVELHFTASYGQA